MVLAMSFRCRTLRPRGTKVPSLAPCQSTQVGLNLCPLSSTTCLPAVRRGGAIEVLVVAKFPTSSNTNCCTRGCRRLCFGKIACVTMHRRNVRVAIAKTYDRLLNIATMIQQTLKWRAHNREQNCKSVTSTSERHGGTIAVALMINDFVRSVLSEIRVYPDPKDQTATA